MKRWVLKAGAYDFDALTLEDAPEPVPGPGQVRVRIEAAALNHRDLYAVEDPAWRPQRDLVPVADGAGVIDAVGPGVSLWTPGDRVITVYNRNFPHWPPPADPGFGPGAFDQDGVLAEAVVLAADRVIAAPRSLSLPEAATLPCAGHTAWTALQKLSPVRPGGTVLILGTGGVSLFALQLCRLLGVHAVITTSQESKRERLLTLGASDVVNYADDSAWGRTVFRLTDGGVDKVVNSAGVGSLDQAMAALKPGGNIATLGVMEQANNLDGGLLIGRSVTIHGFRVGGRDGLAELVAFADGAGLKPIVHGCFHFDAARAAYEAQQSPELFGKVVIEGPSTR